MEFIQIILQNSNLKESKIFHAAQKAAVNPEIGITIQNKAAYHVIKDCANIAMHYLPHLVFGSYQNPFESLKGKFRKESIGEFIKQSETSLPLNQLLHIIITKAEKMNLISTSQQTPIVVQNFDVTDHNGDPYGEYGLDKPLSKQPNDSSLTPYDILCKVFAVTD